MGVEESALDRRRDGDEVAWRSVPGLPVDLGGDCVGIGARPRDHAPCRLGGKRGPQEVLRVEVGASVLGGIGRGDGHELPCGAAQQLAEVDAPRVGRPATLSAAEKVREEVSEGVRTVVLGALLSVGHEYPSPWPGPPGHAVSVHVKPCWTRSRRSGVTSDGRNPTCPNLDDMGAMCRSAETRGRGCRGACRVSNCCARCMGWSASEGRALRGVQARTAVHPPGGMSHFLIAHMFECGVCCRHGIAPAPGIPVRSERRRAPTSTGRAPQDRAR